MQSYMMASMEAILHSIAESSALYKRCEDPSARDRVRKRGKGLAHCLAEELFDAELTECPCVK
jgi:hypothetical protein